MRISLAAALLLALSACHIDLYKPVPFEPPSTEDCSSNIYIPVGLLEFEPTERAAEHAEVYGANPDPYQIRYQWPSRDPSTSAAFLWRTDLETEATVLEFGTSETTLSTRLEGASFIYGSTDTNPGARMHEVRICAGLDPGTTYFYRVGGPEAWSDVYSFTTPQEPGSFNTFRVAMIGDSRGAYATWGTILDQIEEFDPDFYMFSGDMVEFGGVQSEWDAWFDAADDLWTRKALVPAHGNHELLAQHYFANFSLPGNEEWFSVDYGDLHLVSLNDTVRDLNQVEITQVNFMNADLASVPAGHWKVAMHHSPIYSTCTRHGSYLALRDWWEPVFDTHQVDVVMAGHNHIYERSVPIRNQVEVPMGDGTIYIVSGGAGAPLYVESEAEWFGNVANPIEHFIIADYGPTGSDFVVRDLAGNVLDQFTHPRKQAP